MIVLGCHLQWPQPKVFVSLCLICAMALTAFGQLVLDLPPGGPPSCGTTLTTLSPHTGVPAGSECEETSSTDMACYIQCSAVSSCKVAFVTNCQPDGRCTCNNCYGVTHVIVDDSAQFYLHTKETLEMASYDLHFPSGLVGGQPILLKVQFRSPWTALSLETDSKVAFRVRFNLEQRTFKKQSGQVSGLWSSKPLTFPHVDFKDGQEVSVLYVFNSTRFNLHIHNVKFATLRVTYPIEDITRFRLLSENHGAFITSYRH